MFREKIPSKSFRRYITAGALRDPYGPSATPAVFISLTVFI